MPRPPIFDWDSLYREFEKYRIHFNTGIPPPSSDIWTKISTDLNRGQTAKYLYMIFKLNRNGILDTLGLQSIETDKEEDAPLGNIPNLCSKSEDGDSTCSAEDSEADTKLNFDITLSAEEWKKIAPTSTVYKCTDKAKPTRLYRRHEVLPSGWTAIVNEHIWDHTKTRCCLSFKRAKICPSGEFYLRIYAKCSECDSSFRGFMKDEPLEDQRAVLHCSYAGKFEACRNVRKRRMILQLEQQAKLNEFCTGTESAKFFRSKISNVCWKDGEHEPSHFSSMNSYRIHKSRFKKRQKLHPDPVIALLIMKYCYPFQEIIHTIGADPFCLSYWSPSQIAVYNNYCAKADFPAVCIDGTGGLVSQVQRPFKNESKEIQLYSICLYDKVTKSQYSVANLLSEKHDGNTIAYFLNCFFNSKDTVRVTPPKQITTDHSIALLNAAVQSLTQFSCLSDYIQNAAILLSDEPSKIVIPKCFIRCDIAHVVKIITSFKPLKNMMLPRCKDVYIRSMCQLILTDSIDDAKRLLFLIFVAAVSKDGGNDENGEPLSAENAKETLKKRCALGLSDSFRAEFDSTVDRAIEKLNKESSSLTVEEDEVYHDASVCRNETPTPETLNFRQWGKQILEEAKASTQSDIGTDDNSMYAPELPECILRLLETFPLWSNIMKPVFKYGTERASSASVESLFGDIKTRLLAHEGNLPLSADVFLMYHSPYIDADLRSLNNDLEGRFSDQSAAEELDTDEEEDRILQEVLSGTGAYGSCSPEAGKGGTSTFDNVTSSKRTHEEGATGRETQIETDRSAVEGLDTDEEEDRILQGVLSGTGAYGGCAPEAGRGGTSTFDNVTSSKRTREESATGREIQIDLRCPACANGDLPSGGHKCIKCGKSVHIIFPETCGAPVEGSEEGYGQPAMCVTCKDRARGQHAKEPEFVQFAPGGKFSTVTERNSEDNWRGQDLPPKKRRKSYLTPITEIMHYNLSSKGKPTPLGILKNGNRATDLKPVAVGRERYQISRTCAFDSVAQTLACAYCDSDLFRKFVIAQPPDNLLWRIVKSIEGSGVSRWAYYWRASLLSKVCKTEKLKNGITKLDAEVVAGWLCRKLFQDQPSITETEECSMKLEETRKINIPLITIELNPGETLDLSSILNERLRARSSQCKNNSGVTATHHIECNLSASLIIFELHRKANLPMTEGSSDFIETPEYQLKDIPVILRRQDRSYHLRGVICFFSAGFTSIGHYKSYCRRINGYWEIYDDTASKKFSCKSEAKVQSELIFYTI